MNPAHLNRQFRYEFPRYRDRKHYSYLTLYVNYARTLSFI